PSDSSSLFALNRPFHAILKDTSDPRIKKLVIEESSQQTAAGEETIRTVVPGDVFLELKKRAQESRQSVSAVVEEILQTHTRSPGTPTTSAPTAAADAGKQAAPRTGSAQSPVDYITFNVVSAAVLILDSFYEQEA